MRRAALARVAALCVCFATPAASWADGPADIAAARDLFIEGSRLANEGKWPQARDRYERSLALKRAPITLYSLGIAQQKTGRLVAALENLRAFLADPLVQATKPYEKPAREAIAELEKRIGKIRIEIEPASVRDVKITVDGESVPSAALDRPRLVDPGTHEAVATAPGYREARASANVGEGAKTTITLTLASEPVAAAPAAPPTQALAVAPSRDERPSRAPPIALLAGGTAVFLSGAVVGLLGVKEASDAPTRDGPEADAARTKMLIGDVIGGVGVVAAGIGLVLLVTSKPDAAPPKARVTMGPQAAPNPSRLVSARVDARAMAIRF